MIAISIKLLMILVCPCTHNLKRIVSAILYLLRDDVDLLNICILLRFWFSLKCVSEGGLPENIDLYFKYYGILLKHLF